MPWRVRNRTRAFLLIILAVIVLVQGLAFYSRDVPTGPATELTDMDVLLEVYGEPGGVEFSESPSPELPLFDPSSESWTLNGQPLHDFANLIQGLELGPHGSSPFVIVAIPENATIADYRSAAASLSSRGICRV